MAVPWLTLLKTVPWTDVIHNAPKVADGARRLWNTVAGKPAPRPADAQGPSARGDAEAAPDDATRLRARIASLEATTADLHAQMLASSEIIRSLAEQNAELIQGVEANRARVARLTVFSLVSGVLACVALVIAWGPAG